MQLHVSFAGLHNTITTVWNYTHDLVAISLIKKSSIWFNDFLINVEEQIGSLHNAVNDL